MAISYIKNFFKVGVLIWIFIHRCSCEINDVEDLCKATICCQECGLRLIVGNKVSFFYIPFMFFYFVLNWKLYLRKILLLVKIEIEETLYLCSYWYIIKKLWLYSNSLTVLNIVHVLEIHILINQEHITLGKHF